MWVRHAMMSSIIAKRVSPKVDVMWVGPVTG